ncbi:MAG: hypothetical protein HY880_09115, partial [Deltaproteobacteria bacterium]|nr:hypothetical protein [Deltaproteobacteria bacterium]
MLCLKRVWRVVLLISSILLIPDKAISSLVYDPYTNTVLTGTIDHTYRLTEKRYDSSSETNSSSYFTKTYTLDLRGKLWDPKVIVYDLGIRFDTSTSSYNKGKDTTTDTLNYYLRTGVLRSSRFPLLLSASQTTLESSGSNEKNTINTYSLNWLMKFYTLPVTRLFIERTTQESASSSESTTYNLELSKSIGRTKNILEYSVRDSSSGSSGSQGYTLNFINRT